MVRERVLIARNQVIRGLARVGGRAARVAEGEVAAARLGLGAVITEQQQRGQQQ